MPRLGRHKWKGSATPSTRVSGGVAKAVNLALVLLYWRVGKRIQTEILESRRAAYGEQTISILSRQLSAEFGNGYLRPNLFRMVRFAEYRARKTSNRPFSGRLSNSSSNLWRASLLSPGRSGS
jgi:hypothetical protein